MIRRICINSNNSTQPTLPALRIIIHLPTPENPHHDPIICIWETWIRLPPETFRGDDFEGTFVFSECSADIFEPEDGSEGHVADRVDELFLRDGDERGVVAVEVRDEGGVCWDEVEADVVCWLGCSPEDAHC